MKLSFFREGDAVRFDQDTRHHRCTKGERAVIICRTPEDRSSGITRIVLESGGCLVDFVWDHEDPEVSKIGKGRVITKVEIEQGA